MMYSLQAIFKHISSIGLDTKLLDTKGIGRLRLVNIFSVASIITTFLNLPLYLYWGLYSFVYLLLMQVCCYIASLLANYRKQYWLARIILVTQINLAIVGIVNMLGEYCMLQLLFIPLLGLALILFTSQEIYSRIWCIAITCISFSITEIVDYHVFTQVSLSPYIALIIRSVIIVVSLGLNLIILFIYASSLEKAEEEVTENSKQIKLQNQELQIKQEEIATQNEELFQQQEEIIAQRDALQEAYYEIHRKNEDILASINYARRIQNALLPSKEEIDAIFPQNFVLFRPRDIVSGDFYWCIEKDGRKFIAAADCTGHGIPGAFMSMIGVEMLNEIVISKDIMEADKILNKLNLSINKALRQDEGENKDGMDIALCVVHSQTRELEYAGAMNPIIYIQNNELIEVKATKKGVGGHQLRNTDFQGYQKEIISIQTPTMLYLFSDGFQDQFGGKDGRKFMIKNLRQLLLNTHTKPMHEQRHELKEAMTNWMGERYRQIDDILVIGIYLH